MKMSLPTSLSWHIYIDEPAEVIIISHSGAECPVTATTNMAIEYIRVCRLLPRLINKRELLFWPDCYLKQRIVLVPSNGRLNPSADTHNLMTWLLCMYRDFLHIIAETVLSYMYVYSWFASYTIYREI